ncbi:splicing regulatory glutamine/lysine-rich protein 1-like [Bufo bufo]|uniref:splicing regulatory glutamine/lysine-rich protein 1-like n=1 Tax=Bufo bufo TaxID=8384 RepID=UPI001ABD9E1F|nr:splicing regulatory glutamine/lysine-rich protein 1-like [Bufo bufo]
MVAEDVLRQKLEEPKLSHRGPIKAVKINRKNSVEGSLGSPTSDPHRKRKFNGDKKGEDVKEDSSRKETSSPPRSHNGCMAVDPAESSEKVIQENVVSCASEHYVDPGPDCGGEIRKHDSADEDTLPVSSSILDENSNLLQEESESKHCRDKEGQNDPAEEQAFLSCRISAQESDVPPGRLAVTDDLPVQSADGRRNDHTVPSEDPVDHAEEPKDYEIAEDNKDLKENSLEEAAHSSRNGDQRSRADKKPKEHNEVKKKDRHEGKDKRDSEKDKSQEKTTDRVKAEDQEQKMAGSVKKASYAKEQKDRSKSKEDGHKDRSKSKEDGHKDRSKEDGHKDRSKSKEDRHKDRSKGDGHKDRSKEERHKDRSKEERHKASGQSKHKHLVKEETPDTHALHKENGKDTKAGVLKMTLVDLDLFQEALTEDKRHKLKDSTKGKSLDKKASGEKQKDHHKKSDDKDTKRHHSEETKGIKRELEEVVVEAEQKKIKVDPEKDEKVQEKEKSRSKASKKRKNAEDKEGETKAKRTKDAKQKEEDSKWKW